MTTEHFYKQLLFPEPTGNRPIVALNMVTSLDGKVTMGGSLKPGSIGSSFDRQTMNMLRSHFDAVLAGGNTIRQHPFYLGVPEDMETLRMEKGLAPQPLTILLTASGNLESNSPLFRNPPRPPIIFTSRQGSLSLAKAIREQTRVEIFEENTALIDILALLFKKYHVKCLLLEGGPSVNYQFFKQKLVDEVFLTVAAKLVGNINDLTMVMGEGVLPQPQALHLHSVNQYGDELFLRYQISWG